MNQEAVKEIANQLGVGANYLAGHLADFAPRWGMFKAIRDFAGVSLTGFILAVLVFLMRRALKAEGDEAFGYDKTFVVAALGIFASVALAAFGCLAVDAITHLAVPQAAMINDMLEMVQNG